MRYRKPRNEPAASEASDSHGAHAAGQSARSRFGGENSPRFGGLARLASDCSGMAMIEYALLAALIALAIFAGLSKLGGDVGGSLAAVDQAIGDSITVPAGGNSGGSGGGGNGNGGGGNGNGGGGNGNAGGNGNGNGNGNCPRCGG